MKNIFAYPFPQMATKLLINREDAYRQIFQWGWHYIKPGLKPLSGSAGKHIFSIFNTWEKKKAVSIFGFFPVETYALKLQSLYIFLSDFVRLGWVLFIFPKH